ncbi:probable platelet-activating factor acetylhydrolase 2 [Phialocephala subalpina]|uniref:Putative phospholipase n=1 Tax=Phialocephala subalpina TaxID=576137 RepID=A0A1L7WUY9_9HELO|nr:probable platelet-activating factor acetylhydrolase 2 [Phialocephala subalpina]
MTSYLPRLGLVPVFPEYTGPHKVGTIDIELPVSELESPTAAPDEFISTIQYRVFYPCDPESKKKSVNWLPNPQREHVSAYTRFLGAGSMLAEFISFFPRHLHSIAIPVSKNAPILKPTTPNGRWPVMIFSHGLGGNRNAYSHLAGSVASHGMIVIAPEHRDGSAPISYIRDAPSNNSLSEKSAARKAKRTVDYTRYSHTPSPEVEAGRNTQLKIRLWELGLIHDSLLKLDLGEKLNNLNTSSTSLSPFKEMMDVHSPGKITFAGHSFGAATVTQFVKTVFYSPKNHEAPSDYEVLFSPSSRSPLLSQITSQTPIILLDIWCLPLRAQSTRWLWDQPFPCYAPGGPGGSALLAVESQAFYDWRVHLKATKRLLSPDPSSSNYDFTSEESKKWSEPNFFYAMSSAHLSQSDFGLLFPRLTRHVFGSQEPERVMKLNVRAVLQLLRSNGVPISNTSAADMELEGKSAGETGDDTRIFGKNQEVRGWTWLSTGVNDMKDVDDEAEASGNVEDTKATEPTQAVVGNEILKQKEGTAEKL